MKKRTKFLLALVPLLLVFGCEVLFEYNLFDSLDQPEIPTSADLAALGDDALAYLRDALQSDDFIDALSGDDGATQEILDFLADTYLSEAPTEENLDAFQEAAVLFAQIEFAASDADEVSNNLVDAVSSGGDEIDLSAVFPPGMTEAEFDATFDAMISASIAYTKLGLSLTDTDGDGTVDPAGDISMGEVVQDAVIAIYVQTVYENIPGTEDKRRSAFMDYVLNDGPDPVPEVVDIGEELNTNIALNNIFEAADFSMEF